MATYVCAEVSYHIAQSCPPGNAKVESIAPTLEWLGDVPQDEIVLRTGLFVGVPRLRSLLEAAEEAQDWWLAARYLAVIHIVAVFTEGAMVACENNGSLLLEALAKCPVECQPDVQEVQFALLAQVAGSYDMCGVIKDSSAEWLEQILTSPPARRSPELVALIEFVARVMPAMYVGDVDAAIDQMWPFLQKLAKGAESDPSPSTRERCAMLLFAFPHLFDLTLQHPDFDWDTMFGVGGTRWIETYQNYRFDVHHGFFMKTTFVDFFVCFAGGGAWPLALRYGDMLAAEQHTDVMLQVYYTYPSCHCD